MSDRWPGGIVRATPVTPTGPFQNGTAPGMWTLDQANYWIKQGLWPIAGNFLAVEDVFSTYLYTGNDATNNIANGIDLSGKGGMVWLKNRTNAASGLILDTSRGVSSALIPSSTSAALTSTTYLSYNSNGFSLTAGNGSSNGGSQNYASWTFREAPKFFDVVTYTGNGTTQSISHNLGVAPGMIIVKETTEARDWVVYHRSLGESARLFLNATNASTTTTPENCWGNNTTAVAPTSTQFTVGNFAVVNASGQTYVAYIFAHDATSDGIIQCGSFTTDGSGFATVNLGWEAQWALVKRTDSTGTWAITDNIRGWVTGAALNTSDDAVLFPNLTNAETTQGRGNPTSTGFAYSDTASASYIYVAIRRGPMKTPTVGTSVFAPVLQAPSTTAQTKSYGFVTDAVLAEPRDSATANNSFWSRLQGANRFLSTAQTNAENSSVTDALIGFDAQDGVRLGADTSSWVQRTFNWVHYAFRRAPSFFDVVCWTGNGVNPQVLSHNLGVAPQLIINKTRSTTSDWDVTIFNAAFSGGVSAGYLNGSTNFTDGSVNSFFNSPTASTVSVTATGGMNTSGRTNVSYLFASCPGVSKVGSYTGTGTTQTIDCGFTTGSRFVLIKRTDSTGDWYVWDSARGIVAGNDPYLLLNSTAAEVTNTDYIDTDNSGFQISSTAPAAINANGGTFIYLAIS